MNCNDEKHPGNLLVKECPRCHETHHAFFRKLDPPINDLTYWARCDVMYEPILVNSDQIAEMKKNVAK